MVAIAGRAAKVGLGDRGGEVEVLGPELDLGRPLPHELGGEHRQRRLHQRIEVREEGGGAGIDRQLAIRVGHRRRPVSLGRHAHRATGHAARGPQVGDRDPALGGLALDVVAHDELAAHHGHAPLAPSIT